MKKVFFEGEENRRRKIFFWRVEGKGGENFGGGKYSFGGGEVEWRTKRRKISWRRKIVAGQDGTGRVDIGGSIRGPRGPKNS